MNLPSIRYKSVFLNPQQKSANTMNRFNKYILPILIVTICVYLFDQGRMWLTGNFQFGNLQHEAYKFSMYLLYSSVLGFSNFWMVWQLDKRFSWQEVPKKRAFFGVIGAVVVSVLSIFILRIFTVLVVRGQSWSYFIQNESKFVYIYTLFISLLVVLVFYVIYFYKAVAKKSITEHKTIAKTEIAKYESLKSQLDPHFLFNSLNVLTSLIEENPEQAERFTAKLSKVYRYVLEQKEKTLVSLQEEIDFAKVYMELLKMRFEDSVTFDITDKISNPDYKIVPLSLQLLLENAVKHNTISNENPLTIRIFENEGTLIIENNFNEKKSLNKGTGIGLKNILDRYALLTDRQIEIEKTTTEFTVKLPLLTQKTKIMKTNNYQEENKYIKAKERVNKMKEFYANLVSYIGVNAFLIFLNYYTGWEHKWFIYPLLGWGIGLLFHYFEAFGYYPFLGRNWEEKKIKELMNEEDKEMWE